MTKTLFGVAVYCNEDVEIQNLKNTIDSLKLIDYNDKRVKVVISKNHSSNCQTIVHFVNILKETFPASEAVFHLHDNTTLRDTECFEKLTQATYFVKVEAGMTIDKDLFSKIDTMLNEDSRKIDLFETDHFFLASSDSMRDNYLNFNDYDSTTEHIRNLSIKQEKYEKI